jgi:hypothetical protein
MFFVIIINKFKIAEHIVLCEIYIVEKKETIRRMFEKKECIFKGASLK